ncbi:MAG: hypothetical protein EOO26_14175 [Comamonadaceae bacterium]|nr:MAG: hypothetical protein EOO26_14175 [Comamonadaceae bacterium]
MTPPNGYFLADTNSLVYAHRAGGGRLLNTYRDIARADGRALAITRTVADEIDKGPLGKELLRHIANENITVLDNPLTEQRLRAGEISAKNAGEESIVEIANREHAAGRSTTVLSDDKYFASRQKLSEAPGVRPMTSAEALNQAREDKLIPESKYREFLAGYRAQTEFRAGSGSYSQRLDTFDPHRPTVLERVGERLSDPRTAQMGLKVAGVAAVGIDTVITGRETARLLDQDNLTGAQSHIVHFGARNLGMAGGAALGSSAGATFGAPGMVLGGIAGGVGGAIAGEKLADAADRARIHNQRGSDGHAWQSDAQHPERGWSRPAPAHGTDAQGKATYEMQTRQASPRLSDELDYKASSTAVELALAHAPNPKNPFSQPAGPGDAHAVDATSWTRDPATRQWSRYVADPVQAAMGNPTGSTEQASPQRSAQLDLAAQATIAQNVEQSRQGIAQRYQSVYDERGWKQHGPVPAAVLDTERALPAPRQTSAPGGLSFAEAHRRRDEPEKISPGSLQAVDKLPKPDRQQELTLLREIGIVNARTEHEVGKAQSPRTTTPAPPQQSPEHLQERTPAPAVPETLAPKQATPVAVASPATAPRAEPALAPRTFDPRDAGHPHHRDFHKIYTAVSHDGRWDAKESTNIASQVLADFKSEPMGKRLDVVAIEPDLKGQLRVFAGYAPWGERRGLMGTTVVDPAGAARVPAEQGFERLALAGQQQQQQHAQQRAQQQAHGVGQGL